jgi:glycine/D-amino acid oxidase-like deaminating enzyme
MATTIDHQIARDGAQASPWQQGLNLIKSNTYADNERVYDVLIIGGGITGLTAALLLQKEGAVTAIAEAYGVGFGTTGGTSAHINTFADTTYQEAESAFGEPGAQLFADAVNEGFALIETNIGNYKIDCDYEPSQATSMPKTRTRPNNWTMYTRARLKWVSLSAIAMKYRRRSLIAGP